MPLVRVKIKGQATISTRSREQAGLNVGDLLEAKLEKSGKITLTPKSLIDRHLEEGLEDIRKGRTYGPFDTAEEMIASLKGNIRERAKTRNSKRSR